MTPPADDVILSVRDLSVEFETDDGIVQAVHHVSYDVRAGECLGVVGESGSGKTVTSLAILGLLPKTAKVTGQALYRGVDLLGLSDRELQPYRGRRVSMVFQDALAALNPVMTIGAQIAEAIAVHDSAASKQGLRARAVDLLDAVGISNPGDRVDQYPHEFSGGMRQRAMIAMSIANEPDVLIADEPTTALDVTIQAQVLDALERIQARSKSAIVLITHDLGVVAGMADRVLVMYAGRQVEMGTVDQVFYETRHPYTLGLLACQPRVDLESREERLYPIEGQPPSLIHLPTGCAFHPRCDRARLPEPCAVDSPPLRPVDAHLAACHFAEDLRGTRPADLQETVS